MFLTLRDVILSKVRAPIGPLVAPAETLPTEFMHWGEGGGVFLYLDSLMRKVTMFCPKRCLDRVRGKKKVNYVAFSLPFYCM